MSRENDDARADAAGETPNVTGGAAGAPGAGDEAAAVSAAQSETPAPLPVPGVSYEPSRKDRLRPAELIGFSAILSLFVGLVVLLSTREPILSGVSFGIVFIVSLVVLAMFSLSFKPNAEEVDDLKEQNHER